MTRASSIGINLGYNSSADLLNNLIYSTTAPASDSMITGITMASMQATPIRIYHNTINNVNTCFEITDMSKILVENTVCRQATSGAVVFSIDSDEYDMSGLTSNFNAFFNAAGTLSFRDNATGVMSLSDWRRTMGFDKKTISKNPRLRLAHPTKKTYLHLKKSSPLINRGARVLHVNSGSVMYKKRDWDGQVRPFKKTKPDIGVDEVRKA
jgi:hypothetical protein